LHLEPELTDTFRRWGVRTLGELAGLPRRSLGDRLGPAGLRAHDLALGLDRDPFRVYVPEPYWEEMLGLGWEIVALGALTAGLERALERLTARLAVVHVSADAVDLELTLASGATHQRSIALAYPTREVRLMLSLIRLDLEAHPPPAAVVGLTVRARPAVARPTPSELWQPPAPAHRDLAALLTRLTALVGADNLGAAALVDSHHPDAFTLQPFRGTASVEAAPSGDDGAPDARMMLRRAEPPIAVSVVTADDGRPRWLEHEGGRARVASCAGPW